MAYIPGRKTRKEKSRVEPVDIDILRLKDAYEALEETHRQVRETHIEMILNLAIAAEYKDPDTGNHIMRISDYATLVARALKFSEDDTEILRFASPMHDIGKIGIPDSILQKPGKLTPEEWEVMKQHTLIGARIFQHSKSPLLQAASQIAASHHEKFDGSGYPYGLKGESVPLFGRIVTMVDVFDAVVSKRCYKDKWSYKEGLDYIESLAGTHLDPKLVEIFKKIEKEVRSVYDANTTIEEFLNEVDGGKGL
jgi:putative two-component system response regulator